MGKGGGGGGGGGGGRMRMLSITKPRVCITSLPAAHFRYRSFLFLPHPSIGAPAPVVAVYNSAWAAVLRDARQQRSGLSSNEIR